MLNSRVGRRECSCSGRDSLLSAGVLLETFVTMLNVGAIFVRYGCGCGGASFGSLAPGNKGEWFTTLKRWTVRSCLACREQRLA